MKTGSTLSLLVITVLLGGYLYLQQERRQANNAGLRGEPPALQLRAEKVNTLMIERDDWRAICKRHEDGWMLTSPVEARAEAGAVARLLYALEDAVRHETVLSLSGAVHHPRLMDFGLAPPLARLTFDDGRGPRSLRIGRRTALGERVYVLDVESGEVFTVDDTLLKALPGDLNALRDTILFIMPRSRVRRLAVRRRGGYLLLARGEEGRWMIRQPLRTRADRDKVHAFLDSLMAQRITGFVTDAAADPTIYGLADADRGVTFWDSDEGMGQTFLLGIPAAGWDNTLYGRWEDRESIVAVSDTMARLLDVAPDELRDSRLVDFTAEEVVEFSMTSGDQTLGLVRADGLWRLDAPRQAAADQERCSELVRSWTGIRAQTFLPVSDLETGLQALDEPLARLSFTCRPARGSEALRKVSVLLLAASSAPDQVILLREDEDWLAKVDSERLFPLRLNALYYRDRDIMSIAPSTVRRVVLESGRHLLSWSRDRQDGSFRSDDDSMPAGDPALIDDLLAAVQNLRAVRLLTDDVTDEAAHGFSPPLLKASFALSGGTGLSKTLLLRPGRENGQWLAMVRGRNIVFEIDESQVQPLLAPFAGKGLPIKDALDSHAAQP